MFGAIGRFWALARQFPVFLAGTIVLLVIDALAASLSVVSMAPMADLVLDRPQDEWLGPTRAAKRAVEFVGLPFTEITAAMLVWTSMLLVTLISIVVRWSTVTIRMKIVRSLVLESLDKIYDASWRFFASHKKGELINTYVNEVMKSGTAFQALAQGIANVVRVAALVAVPLWMAPALVLGCLAASVIVLFPFAAVGRWSYRFGDANVRAANRFTSLLKESLDGAREVIGFARKDETMRQIDKTYRRFARSRVRSDVFGFAMSQVYEPAGFLILLGVLVAAQASAVEMSTLAIVLWGLLRTIPPLKQMLFVKHQLDNSLPSLEQVRRYQASADAWRQPGGSKRFNGLSRSIRLDNVSFTYPDGRDALCDVSIEIGRGETVALVGESGSGKSTVLDLVLGLHEPTSGRLLVDDTPMRELDLASWRRRVGLVSQHPVLFDLSVRENLVWAQPGAGEDALWRACRTAGAESFLADLPEGLDTEIGDLGVRLSGGQVQRLALARALVRDPELLVLDEATSALDGETEAAIYRSLFERVEGVTTIVVAHRLSTVMGADRIYVMQRGRVVQQGSFADLSEREGYFRALLAHQRL